MACSFPHCTTAVHATVKQAGKKMPPCGAPMLSKKPETRAGEQPHPSLPSDHVESTEQLAGVDVGGSFCVGARFRLSSYARRSRSISSQSISGCRHSRICSSTGSAENQSIEL